MFQCFPQAKVVTKLVCLEYCFNRTRKLVLPVQNNKLGRFGDQCVTKVEDTELLLCQLKTLLQ